MTDKYLCLSLGHNSSAILIQNGTVICGYEQERLSKIKSDSRFPKLAIEECLKYCNSKDIKTVYISHWSVDGNYLSLPEKYYDKEYMKIFSDIVSLSKNNFTHHDAHYWSAKAFSKETEERFTIVADGFGTNWEYLSIYHCGTLINRARGANSLGLLYQYATNFLSLKMHQDEYKLLGYEVYINDIIKDMSDLNIIINKFVTKFFSNFIDRSVNIQTLKTFDDLIVLKDIYNLYFNNIAKLFKKGSFEEKVVISYLVQSIIEKIMVEIVCQYNMKNVILVGGLFLNVKLNNVIAKKVNNICVMPLSGDQGAALGVYNYCHRDLYIKDLYWGLREIDLRELSDNIIVFNKAECTEKIINFLKEDKIINIVHGAMEFGPRALCNTSTLALPTEDNVKYINSINNRDTFMPMAPVMIDPEILFSIEDINKIHKSLQYMVITIDHLEKPDTKIKGIAHSYPLKNKYSSRPQIINKDHILYEVVKTFDILINTSFNIHGTPIVYDVNDINKAHEYQKSKDIKNKIKTIFILDY